MYMSIENFVLTLFSSQEHFLLFGSSLVIISPFCNNYISTNLAAFTTFTQLTHAQNHPKVDYAKFWKMHNHPKWIIQTHTCGWFISKLRIIPSGLYTHLWMASSESSQVDYTKHPILNDLETSSLSSKIGSNKSSKFFHFSVLYR